ncbi:hypothetical protein KI387_030595, partial [Taxus chinensis]
IDYSENFAPVAKMDSVHLVLAIAASQGWPVYQMDVKSAFLHGDYKRKYTWSSQLDLFRILLLFVGSEGLSMVSNKPLGL